MLQQDEGKWFLETMEMVSAGEDSFYNEDGEALTKVAQRGGGASSLKTSKVRLEGL